MLWWQTGGAVGCTYVGLSVHKSHVPPPVPSLPCVAPATLTGRPPIAGHLLTPPLDTVPCRAVPCRATPADFVIYNAGAFPANKYTNYMTSQTSVDLSLKHRELVILGTQYAGEMKKGVFT